METMANDIAILVMKTKIEFNKIIGPACLPTKTRSYEGEFVKVLGKVYFFPIYIGIIYS